MKWFLLLFTLSISWNSSYAWQSVILYRFISLSNFISWNNIEENFELRYSLMLNFLLFLYLILALLYSLNHFLLLKPLFVKHLMLTWFLPVRDLKIRIRIYIVFEHLLLVNLNFIGLTYLINTHIPIMRVHALFESVA
jgi:hypothetical protein